MSNSDSRLADHRWTSLHHTLAIYQAGVALMSTCSVPLNDTKGWPCASTPHTDAVSFRELEMEASRTTGRDRVLEQIALVLYFSNCIDIFLQLFHFNIHQGFWSGNICYFFLCSNYAYPLHASQAVDEHQTICRVIRCYTSAHNVIYSFHHNLSIV